MQKINQLIEQINKKQGLISQNHFQRALNEEISTLRQQLNQKISAVQTLLKSFQNYNLIDFEQKQLHQFVVKQLNSQLNSILQKYNKLQQKFLAQINPQQADTFTGDEETQQIYMQGVRQIENRNEQLLLVKNSVNEIVQMLGQLELQVYECGTKIDRIDQNLTEAESAIDKGIENLQEARKQQKTVNKMRGCTYTLIAVNYIMSIVMICLKVIPKATSSE